MTPSANASIYLTKNAAGQPLMILNTPTALHACGPGEGPTAANLLASMGPAQVYMVQDFKRWPAGVTVNGNLRVKPSTPNTPVTLPRDLHILGFLQFSGAFFLDQLPENLTIDGSLLAGTTGITSLPTSLSVGWNLDLAYTNIKHLPGNLKVNGDLSLGSTRLTELPSTIEVRGDLDLQNTWVRHFPGNHNIKGAVCLRDCQALLSIEDEAQPFLANLDFSYSSLRRLPGGLQVKGDLDISHTLITELPADLCVQGKIIMDRTQAETFLARARIEIED